MPTIAPKVLNAYRSELARVLKAGGVNEGAIRIAFQNLLGDAGRAWGMTVVAEQTLLVGSRKSLRFDGELRDSLNLRRGIWEAKDPADDLEREITSKIQAGYPTKNTLFENSRHAVLYQNNQRALSIDMHDDRQLLRLLETFFSYSEPQVDDFHQAVARFRREIPDLAASVAEIIANELKHSRDFKLAFASFVALCRSSLNPQTTEQQVEEMLIQHLLTERIFRSVFDNPDFVRRNAIAAELEKVITVLTKRAFSRDKFLASLDYFYKAIENSARTISDYSEKSTFLNTVYEQFFQGYSTNIADTHGIVYTPAPIVRWMVASVEQLLRDQFDSSLSDKGVHVLDPCVGTGTFMLEILNQLQNSTLEHKYRHELHCNEILLLPYYIAAQNIEHEFYDRMQNYVAFDGICFADTLEMEANKPQTSMFVAENSQRVQQQQDAPIFVIIGNPPYNVGQQNENDNNKNRKYPHVDTRIRQTYAKSSKASLQTKLYDMYSRFFRWATDRLGDNDGVIAYVSNGSFVEQIAFDGMRKELLKDFTSIYVLDLGGNVRKNPKLSGTTHNVFGIQVSVAITLLIRNRAKYPERQQAELLYARLDEWWRRGEKYSYLNQHTDYRSIAWQQLQPTSNGTWITEGMSDDFAAFIPIGSKEARSGSVGAEPTIFKDYSVGVLTSRDSWVYNFNSQALEINIRNLLIFYEYEKIRWKKSDKIDIDRFVNNDETKIKWSDLLKNALIKDIDINFANTKVRKSLYRPFTKKLIYFDSILNQRRYSQHKIYPNSDAENENISICVASIGADHWTIFVSNIIPDAKCGITGNSINQCFPFYIYDEDGSNRRENISDWALQRFQAHTGNSKLDKWDIFYYVYGLLHVPSYRERYAANLKLELPRIPLLAPAQFAQLSAAGRQLAELHLNYEQQAEYKLKHVENRAVPWTWRVEKMRLSRDKSAIIYNQALTLEGIPPEVYEYRLGNRSALEWVLDQYQVSSDKRSGILSDPNNLDDPEAIVRLIKQVINVSLKTVAIIKQLPVLA
ncbi:type ISP restriction/modification enzyme [Herpetosiphon geysericola]|uniref:site-specific DNA-methyltransferase (adenine-specific) n=1 Tax=Herpetosiphon geysericola TaxID=70996 RepID=A0A0P6Y2I3_9CHLR|nr:type ISP restriction/modification enzyme [Herpetosiphon geysericola]KPL91940.1 DNA helicase [Herpetosiphon geysericola]